MVFLGEGDLEVLIALFKLPPFPRENQLMKNAVQTACEILSYFFKCQSPYNFEGFTDQLLKILLKDA